jgi:hypothetical protein
MISQRRNITYAVFGVGTSVYDEEHFGKLEKELLADGFDWDSVVVEKAASVAAQGEDLRGDTYPEYVEWCYNVCESYDGKIRPWSEERFDEYQANKQERYVKEKTLGEILDNQGEDLDFAICLEEIYGENTSPSPSMNYSDKESEKYNDMSMSNLRKYFVDFLKSKEYDFKEEIEMLSGAEYRVGFDGNLERQKDILENHDCKVKTYRVIPKEGREMHFYFYNQMADMKVKQEVVFDYPFVQIERRVGIGEFGSMKDLEAAVKNGEETGVFENPLLLEARKWEQDKGL